MLILINKFSSYINLNDAYRKANTSGSKFMGVFSVLLAELELIMLFTSENDPFYIPSSQAAASL